MRDFIPPMPLRSGHLQTFLASAGPRQAAVRNVAAPVLAMARHITLECGGGARLLGEYSSANAARGLAVLIHGWEGSAHSAYVLSAAARLFRQGLSVFRLNLRDHGPSHHLNRDPFTSTRLNEVIEAVREVHRLFPHPQQHLVGFSLGGNFALRIARGAADSGLRLDSAVAICPVIRPHITMQHLEEGPFFYHYYFKRNWKRSMLRKFELFPELRDARHMLKGSTLTEMSETFVRRFTPYPSQLDYFQGYAIDGEHMSGLQVPCHVIASEDDPVIHIGEFQHLARPERLHLEVTRFGGHCGFIQDYQMNSWVDGRLAELLS